MLLYAIYNYFHKLIIKGWFVVFFFLKCPNNFHAIDENIFLDCSLSLCALWLFCGTLWHKYSNINQITFLWDLPTICRVKPGVKRVTEALDIV